MIAERLCICAQKGGTSKSVTSLNVATGLAKASWRVLLVDTDPQANTTSVWLGDEEPETDLYDVMTKRASARDAITPTRIDNLSLLPSSLAVARLDSELIAAHRREARMLEVLEPVLSEYDIMVFDMPPSLSPLVISTLAAATAFMIPIDPSRWAMRGCELLLSWVEELREARVVEASLLGVVLAKVEANTLITREIRNALRASELPLFSTEIPKRTGVERMTAQRLVIGDEGADPDAELAYSQLVLEVIERINQLRATRSRHAKAVGE